MTLELFKSLKLVGMLLKYQKKNKNRKYERHHHEYNNVKFKFNVMCSWHEQTQYHI